MPALVGALVTPASAQGIQGQQVVRGGASFTQDGSVTTITASNGAIINYRQFNIDPGQTVRFVQPSSSARVLNRVTGPDPSRIGGTLLANGRVYIVNPSGVYFRDGAVVNVGGIYAAAGSISDRDFLRGVNRFTDLAGEVRNDGQIRADVAGLIGREVVNGGLIHSPGGLVVMAAGDEVMVGERGARVMARVSDPSRGGSAGGAALTNAGSIAATGGRAVLATGDIYGLAIHSPGQIAARSVSIGAGAGAEVRVTGSIDASNPTPGGTGGVVSITGGSVTIDGAQIDASGDARGGSIHIGALAGGPGPGRTVVEGDAVLSADSASGAGGRVAVLGDQVGVVSGQVSASGRLGGGTVLVGGERSGSGTTPRAQIAFVGPAARLSADATSLGAGGTIIVFAEHTARVGGVLSARGGVLGGDGGFVETSGLRFLAAPIVPDVGAPAGSAGTWLLDPFNVVISNDPSTGLLIGGDPFAFESSNAVSNVNIRQLLSALTNGATVIVQTGSGGTDAGTITLRDPLLFDGLPEGGGEWPTLELRAHGGITIQATISPQSAQSLNLVLDGDLDSDGIGVVRVTAPIDLNAGRFEATGAGLETTAQILAGSFLASAPSTLSAGVAVEGELEFADSLGLLRDVTLAGSVVRLGAVSGNANDLIVNAVSQAVVSDDATNLARLAFTGGGTTTLGADAVLSADRIELGEVDGAGFDLTLSTGGVTRLRGPVSGVRTLSFEGDGALTPVGSVALSAQTIRLGPIEGEGGALSVNASSGAFIRRDIAGLSSLVVGGAAPVTTDSAVLESTGVLRFDGPLTLAGAVELRAGGLLSLGEVLGAGHTLRLGGAGTGELRSAVRDVGDLTISLPTLVRGGEVQTRGKQTYTAPITLGADTLFTGGPSGELLMGAAFAGGGFNTTLNFGGASVFEGAATGLGSGTGASLTILSPGTTRFALPVTGRSGISQSAGAGTVTFESDVSIVPGGAPSVFAGSVVLDSLVFLGGAGVTFGDSGTDALRIVGGPVTVSTLAAGAPVTVRAGATVDSSLTLTTGTGDALLAGAWSGPGALTVNSSGRTTFAGQVEGLGSVTTDAPGSTWLDADLNAGGLTFNDVVTITGPRALVATGEVGVRVNAGIGSEAGELNALTITSGAGGIALSGPSGTATGSELGDVVLNSSGRTELNGPLVSASLRTDEPGTTRLAAPVTTRGDVLIADPLLIGASQVTITGNDIEFRSTIDTDEAGRQRSLTVVAQDRAGDAAQATLGGRVGGARALLNLVFDAPAPTLVSTDQIRVTQGLTFAAPVVLARSLVVFADRVLFGGTVDADSAAAGRTLTLNAVRSIFDGAVGGAERLARLSTDSAGLTQLRSNVFTSDGVSFNDAVVLAGDSTIDAGRGSIFFRSTIDGDGVSPRSLALVTARVPTLEDAPFKFGGSIGQSSALGALSLTLSDGAGGFGGPVPFSTIVFSRGFDSTERLEARLVGLGNARFGVRAGSIDLSPNQKLLVFGSARLEATGTVTLGDVTAVGDLDVVSPRIRIRTRLPGPVLEVGANGRLLDPPAQDLGVDFVAGGEIRFSTTPELVDASLPSPTFATPVPGVSTFTIRRFPAPITAVNFADRRPGGGNRLLALDLRSEGTTTANPTEGLAGELALRVPPVPQDDSIGAQLRSELQQVQIFVRPLGTDELIEALVGRSLFLDRPGVPEPAEARARPVAAGRLSLEAVKEILQRNREIQARAGEHRVAIAEAFSLFVDATGAEGCDPDGFGRFVASLAPSSAGRASFVDLADVFAFLDQSGLSPVEARYSKEAIVRDLAVGQACTESQLADAVEAFTRRGGLSGERLGAR